MRRRSMGVGCFALAVGLLSGSVATAQQPRGATVAGNWRGVASAPNGDTEIVVLAVFMNDGAYAGFVSGLIGNTVPNLALWFVDQSRCTTSSREINNETCFPPRDPIPPSAKPIAPTLVMSHTGPARPPWRIGDRARPGARVAGAHLAPASLGSLRLGARLVPFAHPWPRHRLAAPRPPDAGGRNPALNTIVGP